MQVEVVQPGRSLAADFVHEEQRLRRSGHSRVLGRRARHGRDYRAHPNRRDVRGARCVFNRGHATGSPSVKLDGFGVAVADVLRAGESAGSRRHGKTRAGSASAPHRWRACPRTPACPRGRLHWPASPRRRGRCRRRRLRRSRGRAPCSIICLVARRASGCGGQQRTGPAGDLRRQLRRRRPRR